MGRIFFSFKASGAKLIVQSCVIFVGIILALIVFFFSMNPLIIAGQRMGAKIGQAVFARNAFSDTAEGLQEQYRTVSQQLKGAVVDTATIQKLETENKVLRELLNVKQRLNRSLLVANVVARHPLEGISAVTIDRGSFDGIQVGQAVIVSNGILVGIITKVFERSAIATSITDPSSLVSGTLASLSKPIGAVRGEHSTSLEMDLIPRDVKIQQNDIVITAGLEERIPFGFVLGRIDRVESSDNDLFQKAVVRPDASLLLEYLVMVVQE